MRSVELSIPQVRRLLAGHATMLHLPIQHAGRAAFIERLDARRWTALSSDRVFIRQIGAPFAAGDALFVREPWTLSNGSVLYQADDPEAERPWAPPYLMPENAARLHVDVGALDHARLHDIAGPDCVASGAWTPPKTSPPWPSSGPIPKGECVDLDYLKNAFARSWAGSHGAESWDANPWVWRIYLQRTEQERRHQHG